MSKISLAPKLYLILTVSKQTKYREGHYELKSLLANL